MTTFGTIEQAIDDLRNGKIIIVADDEDRENEGDLVCAAELATPEMINFMTLHGRGLICLALTGERCDQLGLPQMTERNTEELSTAFTVSIDAQRTLRRDHGHLGHRSRHHDPCRHQPRHRALRSSAPRTHLPSARPARWGSSAGGADRSQRGSCPAGRPQSGGRDLRDPECRRIHGPAATSSRRSRGSTG